MAARAQRLAINLAYSGLEALHADPPVYRITNFISACMCRELREAARPRLKASTMLHFDAAGHTSGALIRPGAARSSESAYLHHCSVSGLLDGVEELVRQPRTHFEYPQVTRYTEGQQYVSHLDAIDLLSASGARLAGQGGHARLDCAVKQFMTATGDTSAVVVPRRPRASIVFWTSYADELCASRMRQPIHQRKCKAVGCHCRTLNVR